MSAITLSTTCDYCGGTKPFVQGMSVWYLTTTTGETVPEAGAFCSEGCAAGALAEATK